MSDRMTKLAEKMTDIVMRGAVNDIAAHADGCTSDTELVMDLMVRVDEMLLAYSDATGSDVGRSYKNCPVPHE